MPKNWGATLGRAGWQGNPAYYGVGRGDLWDPRSFPLALRLAAGGLACLALSLSLCLSCVCSVPSRRAISLFFLSHASMSRAFFGAKPLPVWKNIGQLLA